MQKIESENNCPAENENDQEIKTSLKYPTSYRILKTILLACIWMSLGFNIEIFGPALEDFKILYNIDYEHIAIIFISRSIGNVIATLIAGLVLDRILQHSNIVIIFAKLIFIIRK
jgi:fucose permease